MTRGNTKLVLITYLQCNFLFDLQNMFQNTTAYPPSVYYILGAEFCERFTYYGLRGTFFFIMRLDGIHYSYTINQWHMIYICEFLKKKFLVKKIFFCFFVFWPLAIIWEKVVVRRKATKTLTWKKSKVQIIQKPFDRFYSDLVSWYNGQTELRNFYDVFEFFKSQMSHVKRLKWKLDDAVPIS